MSGVFRNLEPSPPGECVPLALVAGGGHIRRVERGWGIEEGKAASKSPH